MRKFFLFLNLIILCSNLFSEQIEEIILSKAKAKYPNDYQMQSIELKNELRGYKSSPQANKGKGLLVKPNKRKYGLPSADISPSHQWKFSSDDEELRHNPYENKWEFASDDEDLRHNPYENKWDFASDDKPVDNINKGARNIKMGGGDLLDTGSGSMIMNMGGGDFFTP
jgi:hypothetical protein